MKTSSLRRLAALTGAALLALASPTVSSATPPTVSATTATASATRFVPGREDRYDIDVTHQASLASEQNAPGKALLDYRVRGQWSVTFVGPQADGGRYRVALSAVTVDVAGKPDGESDLRSDLARPFWYDTDRTGRIVGLYFEHAGSAESRGFLRSTAASLEVVLKSGAEWTAIEQDASGEYESRYQRDASTGELRKSRTRYVRMATGGGLRPAADVGTIDIHDDVRIRLNADDALESLSADATTDIQLRSGIGRVHTTAKVSAVLRATGLQPGFVGELERHAASFTRVDMAAALSPDATEEMKLVAAKNLLRDASLAELTRPLAFAAMASVEERGALVARLSASFLVRPADAHASVAIVRASSAELGRAISAGLGGTRTAEAQLALVEIAASSGIAQTVRLNALAALALHEAPTRETASSLARLQRVSDPDVRTAAALALGNVARTMRRADPETARGVSSSLLEALGAATSDAERVTWLRALGNAGEGGVVPFARVAARESSSAVVRIAAASSMRFVAGREVDDLLAAQLATDSDPRVRRELIGLVEEFRTLEDFVPALATVVKNDPAATVRRAAVSAIARLRGRPEVEAALLDASRDDESDDVRAGAAAALASHQTMIQ